MRIIRRSLIVFMAICLLSIVNEVDASKLNDNSAKAELKLADIISMFPIRYMNHLLMANRFPVNASAGAIYSLAPATEIITWAIPTMEVNKTATINVPILCYHVVSTDKASTMYSPYWKLEEHLQTLKVHGYTAITPQQLYEAYYLNQQLPEKPILITFDDGYYDNYSLGYPLLKKYDMQATIFIIGNAIQEQANVSVDGGLPRLSWENIKSMASHVTVQNHTYASHYKSPTPNGKQVGVIATPLKVDGNWEGVHHYWERIATDFTTTENVMKEKVGYGSYIFSYPYGQFSYTTTKVLEHLRIPLAVTIKKGVATSNSSIYELPRLIVNGEWSGEQLLQQIQQMK